MVWADLMDHGRNEYRRKKGRWWRQATGRSNRVIQAIYITLQSHSSSRSRIPHLSIHNRNIVPENVRCVRHSETGRNIRDLTVLHNAIAITDFYRQMFALYATNRIERLLQQAEEHQQQTTQQQSQRVRRHSKTSFKRHIKTRHQRKMNDVTNHKNRDGDKHKRRHHRTVIHDDIQYQNDLSGANVHQGLSTARP